MLCVSHKKEMMTENVMLKEICSQPYLFTEWSAGIVEGHPIDTIYLKVQRELEEPTTILLRRDEALAIIHLLSGALWSESLMPPVVIREGYEFCKTCGTVLGTEE